MQPVIVVGNSSKQSGVNNAVILNPHPKPENDVDINFGDRCAVTPPRCPKSFSFLDLGGHFPHRSTIRL